MSSRWRHAALPVAAFVALLPAAAVAQQTGNDSGVATETQERRSEGQTNDFPIGLLGLLGLAGLAGLRRRDTDYSSPR
jgi:MYXO-CTERM domain-containing protein